MGMGMSIFLLALGAIITWAVEAQIEALNLDIVGLVLMIIGGLGIAWAALAMSDIDGPWHAEEEYDYS